MTPRYQSPEMKDVARASFPPFFPRVLTFVSRCALIRTRVRRDPETAGASRRKQTWRPVKWGKRAANVLFDSTSLGHAESRWPRGVIYALYRADAVFSRRKRSSAGGGSKHAATLKGPGDSASRGPSPPPASLTVAYCHCRSDGWCAADAGPCLSALHLSEASGQMRLTGTVREESRTTTRGIRSDKMEQQRIKRGAR